jgi:hypothetical protein
MKKIFILVFSILLLAGCAGIPTAGPIQIINQDEAQSEVNDVRVIAKPPTSKMNAVQIASGFVAANISTFGDFNVARRYLTAGISRDWYPTDFDVIDTASIQYSDLGTGVVEISALQIGKLKNNHRFQIYPVAKPFLMQLTIEEKVDGLRIASKITNGILTSSDMVRGFSSFNIYFGNENFSKLAPEIIWLPKNEKSVGTQLISSLLEGSSESLMTAIPNGTELRFGSVSISNGAAVVNLNSAALIADNTQRKFMMAQIVWTLQGVPGVGRVQVATNSRVLSTQGKAYLNREDFATLNPDYAKRKSGLYMLKKTSLSSLNNGRLAKLGKLPKNSRFAISEDQKLLAYIVNGELRTAPTSKIKDYKSQYVDVVNIGFDASGRLWFSNTTGNLFCLFPNGVIQKVLQLNKFKIQDFAVSPDNARIAMVVSTQSKSELLVGSLVSENGLLSVVSQHKIEQTLTEVSDVDWINSRDLVVIGKIGLSETVTAEISMTNGSLRNLNSPRSFEHVSASNYSEVLAVTKSKSVWIYEDGLWVKFDNDLQAVYSN